MWVSAVPDIAAGEEGRRRERERAIKHKNGILVKNPQKITMVLVNGSEGDADGMWSLR